LGSGTQGFCEGEKGENQIERNKCYFKMNAGYGLVSNWGWGGNMNSRTGEKERLGGAVGLGLWV